MQHPMTIGADALEVLQLGSMEFLLRLRKTFSIRKSGQFSDIQINISHGTRPFTV
jgi:hypothetical protein